MRKYIYFYEHIDTYSIDCSFNNSQFLIIFTFAAWVFPQLN